jgi:four helix bundle protein
MLKGDEFRARTKTFAVQIIKLCASLPDRRGMNSLVHQLLRSASSIAANCREACRARSHAEFISKIGTCEQEADETQLWLELIRDGHEVQSPQLEALIKECDELIAILVTMSKTAKGGTRR